MSFYRNADTGKFCTLSDAIADTFHDSPSALEQHVAAWLLDCAADYASGIRGPLNELLTGGCQSGMVGHLIYYTDTSAFYQEHVSDIQRLVTEALDDRGADGCGGLFGDKWDTSDPFANDTSNRNLLAWFGFEETARSLGRSAGIDI